MGFVGHKRDRYDFIASVSYALNYNLLSFLNSTTRMLVICLFSFCFSIHMYMPSINQPWYGPLNTCIQGVSESQIIFFFFFFAIIERKTKEEKGKKKKGPPILWKGNKGRENLTLCILLSIKWNQEKILCKVISSTRSLSKCVAHQEVKDGMTSYSKWWNQYQP